MLCEDPVHKQIETIETRISRSSLARDLCCQETMAPTPITTKSITFRQMMFPKMIMVIIFAISVGA